MPDHIDPPAPGGQPESGLTWETFLAAQPDEVRALIDQRLHGIGLSPAQPIPPTPLAQPAGADQGGELAGRLERAEQQTAFYEQVARPGVGCANLRLAWLAAQEGGFSQHGQVDLEGLRQAYPELFQPGPSLPRGDAGAGTRTAPASKPAGFNAAIRRATGRG